MKVRTGFVSNSSSMSFMLFKKDATLSKEELISRTTTKFIYACDEEYANDCVKEITKYASNNEYCVIHTSIDWGADPDEIEYIIKEVIKVTGGNFDDFRIEWVE